MEISTRHANRIAAELSRDECIRIDHQLGMSYPKLRHKYDLPDYRLKKIIDRIGYDRNPNVLWDRIDGEQPLDRRDLLPWGEPWLTMLASHVSAC